MYDDGMKYLEFFACSLSFLFAVRLLPAGPKHRTKLVIALLFCLSYGMLRAFIDGSLSIAGIQVPLPLLTCITVSALAARGYLNLIGRPDEAFPSNALYKRILVFFAVLFDFIIVASAFGPASIAAPLIVYSHWAGGFFLMASLMSGLAGMLKGCSFRAMSASSRVVLVMSLAVAAAVVSGLLGLAFGASLPENVSTVVFSALLVFMFVVWDRHPEYMDSFEKEVKLARYAVSGLNGFDKEKLKRKLTVLMEEEEVFLDDKLSLKKLGDRIGLTPHQLSEFLNNDLDTGFSSYVNSYRIRKANGLLLAKPDVTVLEIAFEAGFGNKTSFNRIFLSANGMTPADFRKKNLDMT